MEKQKIITQVPLNIFLLSIRLKITGFIKKHKKLFLSIFSLLSFITPVFFYTRPDVHIAFYKLLNPNNPFSALFIIQNNSNYSIKNVEHQTYFSIFSPTIILKRTNISHNVSSLNHQNKISNINSHESATLNKFGLGLNYPPDIYKYCSVNIIYSYEYFGIKFIDSAIFKTNLNSNNEFDWTQYSYENDSFENTFLTSYKSESIGRQSSYKNNLFFKNIPKGWVLDEYAGNAQGFQTVFYPLKGSWSESPSVMYINTISKNIYSNRNLNEVIQNDIERFKNNHKDILIFPEDIIKILGNKTATIKKFFYSSYEVVAYIDEPLFVSVLVLSSRTKEDFNKDYKVFMELLLSYNYPSRQ